MKECLCCGTELTDQDREIIDLMCGVFIYTCSKCGAKC